MIVAPRPMQRRVAATQALLDSWKGRPFDWRAKSHCARLVADHLRAMGYTPPLSKAGPFSTERGALAALKRLGVATLADAVDKVGLPRIVPAAAIVGDIVELPSASRLGCLTVCVGNGASLGFIDGHDEAVVLRPSEFGAAWRVEPI